MLKVSSPAYGEWTADGINDYQNCQKYAKKLWSVPSKDEIPYDIFFATPEDGSYFLAEVFIEERRILFSGAGTSYVPTEKVVLLVLDFYYDKKNVLPPSILFVDVKNNKVIFDCINHQEMVWFSSRPNWLPSRNMDIFAFYIGPGGIKIPIRINGAAEQIAVVLGCRTMTKILCKPEKITSEGARLVLDLYSAMNKYPRPVGVDVLTKFIDNVSANRTGDEKLSQLKHVFKRLSTKEQIFSVGTIDLTQLMNGEGKFLDNACEVVLDISINLGPYNPIHVIYNPKMETIYVQFKDDISAEEIEAIQDVMEEAIGIPVRVSSNSEKI